jgi:hypothetical protein
VYLSEDGSTFVGDPVAAGEWADSGAAKVSPVYRNKSAAHSDREEFVMMHIKIQNLEHDLQFLPCKTKHKRVAWN